MCGEKLNMEGFWLIEISEDVSGHPDPLAGRSTSHPVNHLIFVRTLVALSAKLMLASPDDNTLYYGQQPASAHTDTVGGVRAEKKKAGGQI